MATTSPSSAARLSTPWIFWRDRWDQIDGQTVQSLTDLGEVATARSFWTLYKQNAVDDLPDSCSLHVFKRHVKPEWEDPSNINGGHFRFMSIPSSGTGPQQPEEKFWYSVISGSIGDQFTLSSAINGLGFTNKATRKVISIWLNTTDPAVVVALQREFSQFSQDRFTCKFVAHRTLPRSTFTAHQTCDHRRTKSAPEKYLHLEFDGEESPRASQSPQHQTERANVLDAASDLEDVLLKKRADNTTTNSPGGTSNPTTEQLMNLVDHARSKSEGFRQDTVPELRKLRGGTPPPIGETREDLRESGSSGCFPVPTVKAPSPMKVWADQWSPSLLNANQMRPSQPFAPETISALEHQHQQQEAAAQYNAMLQQQQQQVMMAMQQGQPVVFQTPSPTQGGYYAPHHVVVGPPPSQVHVVQYQHTATGGLQFNQGVAPQVPDRSVFGGHHQQQHYHQQNNGHRGNTPPPATRGGRGGRSGEKPHSKSPTPPPQQQQGKDKPPVEQQQTKSDSPPFVFNGYKFPAGLNRKERRRIMFSGEVDPKTYEGTVFVGEDVPNGTCGADGSLPTGETAE